ncbi:hypothetical protein Bra1253DRAFT_05946 [Bradyrhizobium sp. WSM1253]|nr:hypothetical protein Bra1253DRAFT_05946 [Bradyrhizobium sp. WSM1253]
MLPKLINSFEPVWCHRPDRHEGAAGDDLKAARPRRYCLWQSSSPNSQQLVVPQAHRGLCIEKDPPLERRLVRRQKNRLFVYSFRGLVRTKQPKDPRVSDPSKPYRTEGAG